MAGKQGMLTGSADDEDATIDLRDTFRWQMADATAARRRVTLGCLLDEWLAGHQIEGTTRTSYSIAIEKFIKARYGRYLADTADPDRGRPFEQLYAELRVCRRRCKGRQFVEHCTHREHECDRGARAARL